MQWNYTVEDAIGRPVGWVLYRVDGSQAIDGHPAHAVEVTRQDNADADHDGVVGELETHREWFDTLTLHRRDVCKEAEGCVMDFPLLDFPLWDGKVWSYWCCDDVVHPVLAAATQVPGGTWNVSHRTEGMNHPSLVIVFSETAGFVTRWEHYEYDDTGRVKEVWRLS